MNSRTDSSRRYIARRIAGRPLSGPTDAKGRGRTELLGRYGGRSADGRSVTECVGPARSLGASRPQPCWSRCADERLLFAAKSDSEELFDEVVKGGGYDINHQDSVRLLRGHHRALKTAQTSRTARQLGVALCVSSLFSPRGRLLKLGRHDRVMTPSVTVLDLLLDHEGTDVDLARPISPQAHGRARRLWLTGPRRRTSSTATHRSTWPSSCPIPARGWASPRACSTLARTHRLSFLTRSP